MSADWITSQTVRQVAGMITDPRPAWLWPADGEKLLWQNAAAHVYRDGLTRKNKPVSDPVPIGGQVARAVRLGVMNHSSLARMQFTAGSKPISLTCTGTPLRLQNGTVALLIAAVDPVDADKLAEREPDLSGLAGILGVEADFALVDDEGTVRGALGAGAARHAESDDALPLGAGPNGTLLAYVSPATPVAEQADIPPDAEVPSEAAPETQAGLSILLDRLADDAELFTPLNDDDDQFVPPAPKPIPDTDPSANEAMVLAPSDFDHEEPADTGRPDLSVFTASQIPLTPGRLGAVDVAVEPAGADDTADPFVTPGERPNLPENADLDEDEDVFSQIPRFRLTGRGFTPEEDSAPHSADTGAAGLAGENTQAEASGDEGDAEVTRLDARTTRYNFDELSRVLNERVSADDLPELKPVPAAADPGRSGSLVNLGDETLILNRLPIGLLVFRDQQILFSNRALADLTGYEDTASLRKAGLQAIFPDTPEGAGPVNQLQRADGSTVPVTARLQTATWQGQTALLLSARQQDAAPTAEGALSRFGEQVAGAQGDGFFETDRAGMISSLSKRAAELYARPAEALQGRPVHGLIALEQGGKLRDFLELPARMGGGDRPHIRLEGSQPGLEVHLFAEGRAGLVSGYIGFVRRTVHSAAADPGTALNDIDPGLLARVSRGVRRPLNTVIGFSELIRTNAFGEVGNERYTDYARDIETAGQDIAHLVDELEDYARLREGDYPITPEVADPGQLLDDCLARVRRQAGAARVFLRSAISENLPLVTVDTSSLKQALLNLLASAIDQTPAGGQVVLAANLDDDGSIVVHLRDSAAFVDAEALDDRFVVFRDGMGPDGKALRPVQSTVGLTLTRSLLAANACSLSVDPTAGTGTLMSLVIPRELIADATG